MKTNYFRQIHSFLIHTVLIILVVFVGNGFTTNGYFSHGYGTQNKGMAGVGVALPLDAFAPATNPAGLARIGKRIDLGMAIFNPNRQYTVTGNPSGFPQTFGLTPGTVESESNYFVIPSVAASLSLPGGHHLGLVLYGNGGMNTDYPTDTFYGTKPTGVDLSQLFTAVTYSREIVSGQAVGVSVIFAWQRFKAQGLQAFGQFSSDPDALTNNDYSTSTGFGVRIGYMGRFMQIISLGVSYQTKMAMSEFDDYKGLFAEQGDFDIPASWNAGVAVQATPLLTLSGEVQQILYSQIPAIANPLLPNIQQASLGSDNGAGFGWEDMTIFKLGAMFTPLPGWNLRLGYSIGEQPIPESEVLFNILAPGVIEQHVTFGVSKTLIPMVDLHFAFMYGFQNSVKGSNPLEAPSQQQIEIEMNQLEGEVGVSISL